MDVQTLSIIINRLATANLKDSSVKVMLFLLSLPGHAIEWTKFNQKQTAEKLHMKKTSICLGVGELCESGFIEKRGKSQATEYRLVLEKFRKEVHAA